ncbi:MAG: ArsR family transcriptional regulator, partial [Pseudomonadales bacterium]
ARWAAAAGLNTCESLYVGLRNGFQIQVRHFAKPSLNHGLRAATTGH